MRGPYSIGEVLEGLVEEAGREARDAWREGQARLCAIMSINGGALPEVCSELLRDEAREDRHDPKELEEELERHEIKNQIKRMDDYHNVRRDPYYPVFIQRD